MSFVKKPLYCRAGILMRRRTAIMAVTIVIILLTIFAAVNVFPHFDLFIEPYSGIKMCMPTRNVYYHEMILPWIDQVIYTMAASILISTMNVLIIWKLYRAKSKRKDLTTGHDKKSKNEDMTHRVTVMLLTVSCFFLLSTLPLCIFHIGRYSQGNQLFWLFKQFLRGSNKDLDRQAYASCLQLFSKVLKCITFH